MNLLIGLMLTALTVVTNPPAAVDSNTPSAAVERTPIFLQTDAQDAVGAAYVTRLRNALQTSSTFRAVANPADARFIVGIVTMDPNEAEAGAAPGRATVAAVTLQRENAPGLNQFVYSWVLVAKPDKVDSLATELLAAVDQEIRALERPTVVFVD